MRAHPQVLRDQERIMEIFLGVMCSMAAIVIILCFWKIAAQRIRIEFLESTSRTHEKNAKFYQEKCEECLQLYDDAKKLEEKTFEELREWKRLQRDTHDELNEWKGLVQRPTDDLKN
jgi:hypothetical protein